MAETGLATIESLINDEKPGLVVIDSIQTIFNDELTSAPGSVSPGMRCTRADETAKSQGNKLWDMHWEGSTAGQSP